MKISKSELKEMIQEVIEESKEALEAADTKTVKKLVRDIKASRVKINAGFKSNDMSKVEAGVVDYKAVIKEFDKLGLTWDNDEDTVS
jgi:hypothetical protein